MLRRPLPSPCAAGRRSRRQPQRGNVDTQLPGASWQRSDDQQTASVVNNQQRLLQWSRRGCRLTSGYGCLQQRAAGHRPRSQVHAAADGHISESSSRCRAQSAAMLRKLEQWPAAQDVVEDPGLDVPDGPISRAPQSLGCDQERAHRNTTGRQQQRNRGNVGLGALQSGAVGEQWLLRQRTCCSWGGGDGPCRPPHCEARPCRPGALRPPRPPFTADGKPPPPAQRRPKGTLRP